MHDPSVESLLQQLTQASDPETRLEIVEVVSSKEGLRPLQKAQAGEQLVEHLRHEQNAVVQKAIIRAVMDMKTYSLLPPPNDWWPRILISEALAALDDAALAQQIRDYNRQGFRRLFDRAFEYSTMSNQFKLDDPTGANYEKTIIRFGDPSYLKEIINEEHDPQKRAYADTLMDKIDDQSAQS
jgi:hypothetical protein